MKHMKRLLTVVVLLASVGWAISAEARHHHHLVQPEIVQPLGVDVRARAPIPIRFARRPHDHCRRLAAAKGIHNRYSESLNARP